MSVLERFQPDNEIFRALTQIVGPERVSVAELDRIAYATDCLPLTMIRKTEDRISDPPDYIVWPESTDEVVQIVRLANERDVPLVPFGAGSGVCGGTIPLAGGIVVDLKRLNKIISIDEQSMLVTVEAGIIGEHLERELNRHGYTMGHFPSSVYCSTLGGHLAARSAGQLSTKYGKIEDIVVSIEAVLGEGTLIHTPTAPRMATGPDVMQALVGSEGTLGFITRATMRIWPVPPSRRFSSFKFKDAPSGVEAIRLCMRRDLRPAAIRLYDEFDTYLVGSGRTESSGEGVLDLLPVKRLGKAVGSLLPINRLTRFGSRLALSRTELINKVDRLTREGCLMVMTFEGDEAITAVEQELAEEICLQCGGQHTGPGPARKWWEGRYHVSYNMSKVFYSGAFVDTCELATAWDRIDELYVAVKEALSPLVFVMAHFSHAYLDGCSIYFSFVGAGRNATETERLYNQVWEAAMGAATKLNATISHHHGVGFLKSRWMPDEHNEALRIFRALKEICDPRGVMNPRKMGL
ncbi:MAG: FAD-binding oxidoreductase [Candidatus Alcyoniella australis]|nr:FAD-binding oxidoreductase [Candidatus Alcyoniella australis]